VLASVADARSYMRMLPRAHAERLWADPVNVVQRIRFSHRPVGR
jgi:hypothetical protein